MEDEKNIKDPKLVTKGVVCLLGGGIVVGGGLVIIKQGANILKKGLTEKGIEFVEGIPKVINTISKIANNLS